MAPDHRGRWHTQTMAACTQCDGLMESLSFDKPREYLELARRLMGLVNDGILILTDGTCPLNDLFKPNWPANTAEHNFECKACGRTFQLFADTYLGHAGWGLTGPPRPDPTPVPENPPSATIELAFWDTSPTHAK